MEEVAGTPVAAVMAGGRRRGGDTGGGLGLVAGLRAGGTHRNDLRGAQKSRS